MTEFVSSLGPFQSGIPLNELSVSIPFHSFRLYALIALPEDQVRVSHWLNDNRCAPHIAHHAQRYTGIAL